jgi:hypothetical protein
VTRILTGVAALVVGVGAPLLSGCGASTGLQVAAALDGGSRDGETSEAPFEASTVRTDASVELDAMTVTPIPDTGPEASTDHTSAEASTRCTMAPNQVGAMAYGPPHVACAIMWQETCDGMPYYATCACPQGTCSCVGQTTTVVNNFSYQGCANCYEVPPSDIFALCGFPQ